MRHYILTRAVYGSAWRIQDNRRRLELFEAVTVASLTAQTRNDWTWIVALGEDDPLLPERLALLEQIPNALPILTPAPAEGSTKKQAAHVSYRAPWHAEITGEGPLLTTRIDDDDAFTPDAMERLRAAIGETVDHRRAWIFPHGILVSGHRYEPMLHTTNAWSTLAVPAGDDGLVYDFGHKRVREYVPVSDVDISPAWLWVRHPRTISRDRPTTRPLDDAVRGLFPIDWQALEAAWR